MTTTDWRELCAELLDEVAARPLLLDRELVDRARAALAADREAEPVTEVAGPSLREVSDWITKCGQNPEENGWTRRVDHHDALAIAKAALYDWGRPAPLQPEPEVVGPSIEDVERLCEEHCFNVEGCESVECLQGLINEAVARWGGCQGLLDNSTPTPEGEVG